MKVGDGEGGDGRGSGLLGKLFRRLFPGPLGGEAWLDMEREFHEHRAARGRLSASLWYLSHFFRPSTLALARALRRDLRRTESSKAKPVVERGWQLAVSWLDVKLGLRMLAKSPVITAVSGVAIAVTIAIAVAGFSFFQDFLLRPALPLDEGDRIVSLGLRTTDTNLTQRRLLHEAAVWRDELQTLEDVSMWRHVNRTIVSADGQGEVAMFAAMSASGFDVARVPPLLGRPLLESDEVDGSPRVVVLGYAEWVNRFGADPEIIGASLQIGQDVHTIVGVMPKGFAFPYAERLWIPPIEGPDDYPPMEGPDGYFAFGRLAPGVTIHQARAEMEALTSRRASVYPDTHTHLRGQVLSYTDAHTGMDDTGYLGILFVRAVMGLITLVILMPLANVAILVYARTARRSGEIAVRTALGASRMRVVGQLFAEALVLSVPSALVGVGVAVFALGYAEQSMETYIGWGMPFWSKNGRDPWAIAYATGLTLFAAVVAGVVPGLQATGRRFNATLKGAGNANGMQLGKVWTGMVVIQVAITVALLPLAGGITWQAIGLRLSHPTFAAKQYLEVLVAGAPLDARGDTTSRAGVDREVPIVEIADRLEADPRITGVALSSRSPVGLFSVGFSNFNRVDVEGIEPPEEFSYHRVGAMEVDVGFFGFLGVSVEAGREFVPSDLEDGVPVVVVNRAFVDRVLGGANAIGRSIRAHRSPEEEPAPWRQIVGVVSELMKNPMYPDASEPMMFGPLDRADGGPAFLTVRAPLSSDAIVADIRRTITSVDPGLRLFSAAPLSDPSDPIQAVMAAVAIGVGVSLLSILLLCTAGVFSLVSFNVTRRRREIGIRRALGASAGRVLRAIMARSAKQLMIGVAFGIFLVAITPPFTLDGTWANRNPWFLVGTAALLVGMGLVGAVGPARAGLRVQPTEALKGD